MSNARTSSQLPFAGLGCVHVGIASSSPSSVGYCPIDRRFSSFFESVLFCIADGGAFVFAFLAADEGVALAGLLPLRFAVGVDGAERLGLLVDMADEDETADGGDKPCVLICEVDTDSSGGGGNEESGDPDSDAERVGLPGVGVVVRDRDVGCGIRLREVFCVARLVGVSLRSREGEETEPFG